MSIKEFYLSFPALLVSSKEKYKDSRFLLSTLLLTSGRCFVECISLESGVEN